MASSNSIPLLLLFVNKTQHLIVSSNPNMVLIRPTYHRVTHLLIKAIMAGPSDRPLHPQAILYVLAVHLANMQYPLPMQKKKKWYGVVFFADNLSHSDCVFPPPSGHYAEHSTLLCPRTSSSKARDIHRFNQCTTGSKFLFIYLPSLHSHQLKTCNSYFYFDRFQPAARAQSLSVISYSL